MAGMLPGVEAARRRRFHDQSASSSTRRSSSFCLYASSHDHFHFTATTTSSMQRNTISQQQGVFDESRLGTAAREAKKRLDERLQPLWRSETNRIVSSQQRLRSLEDTPTTQANVQLEVCKLKKSGSKRLNWSRLSWKSTQQEECAVCLEQFNVAQDDTGLMHLPCAHKFHTHCLLPWLDGNAHCPCCRMSIASRN